MTGQLKKIYFIDHYDSFSWNVVDWLRGDGTEFGVVRISYDDAEAMNALLEKPGPLVISPGPRNPLEAGATIRIVSVLLGQVPVLGICLGHQILGHIAGLSVTRAAAPFHGSAFTVVRTSDSPLFTGMPPTFFAATYNSLVVSGNMPAGWEIDAVSETGEIQALSRTAPGQQPAYGVQFHPESFLTSHKDVLRRNWLQVVDQYYLQPRPPASGESVFAGNQTSATAPLSMPS